MISTTVIGAWCVRMSFRARIGGGGKRLEIENLFTRRAQSHEKKSWLCYLEQNTWGTAACFMFNFSIFLRVFPLFSAVSVISYSAHKINLELSVRMDSKVMPSWDLLCWLHFLPHLLLSLPPSNNHSWYSGVSCSHHQMWRKQLKK